MKENFNDDGMTFLVEIDPEKRAIYISDYGDTSGGGIAKRYKYKKDIVRMFANYLYKSFEKLESRNTNDRRNKRKTNRKIKGK